MRTGWMTVLVALALAAPSVRAQDFAEAADDAQEKASRDRQRASETAQRNQERAREESERDREQARQDRDRARADERANREDERYERGTEALDEERWDRAIESFDSVVSMGGRRADAGLYWKAYAQNKLGQRAEALNTIAQFKTAYPKSHWNNDMSALEIDVRQHSGQLRFVVRGQHQSVLHEHEAGSDREGVDFGILDEEELEMPGALGSLRTQPLSD